MRRAIAVHVAFAGAADGRASKNCLLVELNHWNEKQARRMIIYLTRRKKYKSHIQRLLCPFWDILTDSGDANTILSHDRYRHSSA